MIESRDDTPSQKDKQADYWEEVGYEWSAQSPQRLWRQHSDAVNLELLSRWLSDQPVATLLKTDLFDEACGEGLVRPLQACAERIVATDVAGTVLEVARSKNAGLVVVQADVRRLPFGDGVFDVVVSNSTLDHFDSFEELVAGLCELRRVLRPRGQLLLTLDNLANPLIVVRNFLPFEMLHRLGLLPYRVGATCGPRRLRRLVTEEGFQVLETTAIMHCPRVAAIPFSELVDRRCEAKGRMTLLRWLKAFERLQRFPTRFRTGHFVAIRAVKR